MRRAISWAAAFPILWLLAACGGSPKPVVVTSEGVVHHGMVTGVEGSASVSEGDACEVRVQPTDDVTLNCRVQVRCGREILYGYSGAGYNHCAEENGRFYGARDAYQTRADGDPAMGWDQRRHVLLVTDSGPDFTVTIALAAQ